MVKVTESVVEDVALDCERFGHGFERQSPLGFCADEPVEHAPVLEVHDGHAKIGRHHRTRITIFSSR